MVRRRVARVRGFSLVEMLLAVFILGIGVISIAALFPAGIVLQRQAADDIVGPIVVKNAFATIRSKLDQSDFGRIEE
ncbi:MAG: prepilin-type N-terminal cleavage/methylation domain-containing protein, partial [bacterium]